MNKKFWIFPLVAIVAMIVIIWIFSRDMEETPQIPPPSPSKEENLVEKKEPEVKTPEKSGEKRIEKEKTLAHDASTTRGAGGDIPTTNSSGQLRIFGTVRNNNKKPLGKSEVWSVVLEDFTDRRLGAESGRTETNDNGNYELFVPTGKNHLVYARAKNYALGLRLVLWDQASATLQIEVSFALSPGMAISGIVKDKEDKPIPGATVAPFYQESSEDNRSENMQRQIPPSVLSVKTDENGRFVIEGLEAGLYTLAAVKEGYSPAVKKGVPSPSDNVEMILEKGEGGVIGGSVFYFSSGEPASDAVVSVRSIPFTLEPVSVKTGSGGEFWFTGLVPGVFEISAEKDQMRSMPYGPIDLLAGKEKTDVVLRLFNGYAVSGHVYEEGGAKTLPGVLVSVRIGFQEEGLSATSDGDGAYAISGIFSRTVIVFGEMEGYFHVGDWGPNSPLNMELPAEQAEVKNVDLIMSRGVKVSGRVVFALDESPIQGAEVRFITESRTFRRGRQPISTNAEGEFSGYVQNHTRMTVQAVHKDYAEGSSNPISVSNKPVENILIKMGKGGTVRGIVVAPDDQPVPGAQVRGNAPVASASVRRRSSGRKDATTDGSGRFVMDQVPAGEFYLSATTENYSPSVSKMVRVAEGQETEEVRLVLSASRFIEGVVKNENGDPVLGARVTALDRGGGNRRYETYSEPEGRFRISQLTRGKFNVSASKGSAVSKSVEVPHDTANVELILKEREYASLTGRVVDAATGEPVGKFTLRAEYGRILYGDFSNPEGRFYIEELVRDRSYRFNIEAPGYVSMLSLPVNIPAEGDAPEVVFEIGQGGSIFGRVLKDGNKSPVEGAKITWGRASQWRPTASPNQVTFTGRDGAFLFEGLSPDVYRLKIEKAGYPEAVADCAVKMGEIADVGEILLKASGKINGCVMDGQETPQPVPNKIVNLTSRDHPVPFRISYKTGEDGRYIFKDLPEGKYVVAPLGAEYAPAETTLQPGETKTINFRPKTAKKF